MNTVAHRFLTSPKLKKREHQRLAICAAMDRQVARELSVRAAARRLRRTRRGFSLQTILITYYKWLKSGRDPASLRAQYRRVHPALPVTAAQRRKLPGLMDKSFSLAAVHAGLYATARHAPSVHAFRRTFSKDELQFLCRMFAERRQLRARARAVQRRFGAWVDQSSRSFTANTGGARRSVSQNFPSVRGPHSTLRVRDGERFCACLNLWSCRSAARCSRLSHVQQ